MGKKLLYISVNSKPELISSSKTVARAFINKFVEKYPDFDVEEIDLYKEHIPRLEYTYFEGRNCIINEESAKKLPEKDQKEIERIRFLSYQFKIADMYVIAAPMWSLSFPAPLKEYIDCIIQDKITIDLESGKMPVGLLKNKYRALVYVQSSGGKIPWAADIIMDRGQNYIRDMMKILGITTVKELKVEGTGTTEKERLNAIEDAKEKIDRIIDELKFKK